MARVLSLYRRHIKRCPHRAQGQNWNKCDCPIWIDGTMPGAPGRYRRSLGLRDWRAAVRQLAALELPEAVKPKPAAEAIAEWENQLQISESSQARYRRITRKLAAFCARQGIGLFSEIGIEQLERFRAGQKLARSTSAGELQVLRQLFAYCVERRWAERNWARSLRAPPAARSREVVPYTREEMAEMLVACDRIGRGSYERLRARALVLLLRFTGLRVTDAYCLRRERVEMGGDGCWKIRLYTQKTGGHILLPIPQEMKAALDALPLPKRMSGTQVDSGCYFWSGGGKKERCRQIAWRLLAAVFLAAGTAGGHAHRFRHTLATDVLAQGGTMADVADVLGISEQVARKHYAKWSPARQERILALMEAVQSGTPMVQRVASRPN